MFDHTLEQLLHDPTRVRAQLIDRWGFEQLYEDFKNVLAGKCLYHHPLYWGPENYLVVTNSLGWKPRVDLALATLLEAGCTLVEYAPVSTDVGLNGWVLKPC